MDKDLFFPSVSETTPLEQSPLFAALARLAASVAGGGF